MTFILTFLLVASLEIATANDDIEVPSPPPEVPEEPDICVGCDDNEKEAPEPPPQLTVEIRIDPTTGKVQYIIRGITIE